MNVLYLTWGETIVSNGIFNNQVMSLLHANKNNCNFTLVSGLPISKKLLFSPRAYFKKLRNISNTLQNDGIAFKYMFLPAPSIWFYCKKNQLSIFTSFYNSLLNKLILDNNIDIIHCRSYLAAQLAARVKKKYGLDQLKIIFDTRSIFPEEGLLLNKLNKDSYLFWKKIEKGLYENCDSVIAISKAHAEFILEVEPTAKVSVILASANLGDFFKSTNLRNTFRISLSIPNQCVVLVYLGSFSGWHTLDNLIKLYSSFRKAWSQSKLLIISQSNINIDNFPYNDEIIIKSADTAAEVNNLLNIADFAALPFKPHPTDVEILLGRIMIGSKASEYLAVGLPIIINSHIKGITSILNNDLGVFYHEGLENDIITDLKSKYHLLNNLCTENISLAEKYFHVEVNAELYSKLYKRLISE